MRTTLEFDDRLLIAAKKRAADDGTTLTRVIENALRLYLAPRKPKPHYKLELVVKTGRVRPGVDLADRDALYDLMDETP